MIQGSPQAKLEDARALSLMLLFSLFATETPTCFPFQGLMFLLFTLLFSREHRAWKYTAIQTDLDLKPAMPFTRPSNIT